MYTNIKYNVMIGQQVKTFVKPSPQIATADSG
jgi:hypothetical protein